MKKILFLILILIFFISCRNVDEKKSDKNIAKEKEQKEEIKIITDKPVIKKEDLPIPAKKLEIKKIEIKSDKVKIIADGRDKIIPEIKIYGVDEKEIQNINYELYINEEKIDKNEFFTLKSGYYEMKAKINSIESNIIIIEAYDKVSKIILKTDKNEVLADGKDFISFTIEAKNQNEEDMDEVQFELLYNDKPYSEKIFKTKEKGEYKFKAKSGDSLSQEIIIKAIDKVTEIEIFVSKKEILANNIDNARITIILKDQNGKIVKDKVAKLYKNDELYSMEVFNTDKVGKYKFKAVFNDVVSNEEEIECVPVEDLKIEEVTPGYDAQNVDVNTIIKINFNKIIVTPLPEDSIIILDENDKRLNGIADIKKGNKFITYELFDKLKYGNKYQIIVSKDIEGIEKNKLKNVPIWFFKIQDFVPYTMKKVDKGEFVMGDEYGDLWKICRPVHKVKIDYNYEIGVSEVTFKEYDAYCKAEKIKNLPDDNRWGRGDNPVINVSWYDAVRYCNWLSSLKNLPPAYETKTWKLIDENGNITNDIKKVKGYRLLTEAEWEYAARGGARGRPTKYSGSDYENEVAWYIDNSTNKIRIVRQKRENELGIYDMSGNVWEWCHDGYKDYTEEEKTNPIYENEEFKVMRGGSWYNVNYDIRVAYREYYNPNIKDIYFGFRIARTLE